jgi:hypothetical protein
MSRKETLSKTFAITLKELKLAKVGRQMRSNPCTKEMESYLSALDEYGEESTSMAKMHGRTLAKCMDQWNSSAHKPSISYHLSKFVKR